MSLFLIMVVSDRKSLAQFWSPSSQGKSELCAFLVQTASPLLSVVNIVGEFSLSLLCRTTVHLFFSFIFLHCPTSIHSQLPRQRDNTLYFVR